MAKKASPRLAAPTPSPAAPATLHDPRFNPRELTAHHVNGLNEAIQIRVHDDAGPGGAHHRYEMTLETPRGPLTSIIEFQNGPIQEVGHNGFTNEALLAIVEDRIACFQAGRYACDENQAALDAIRAAQAALKQRTSARMARGVEGTHER